MFARTVTGLAGVVVSLLTVGIAPVAGQVRGRVVVAQGPIAVDIVFGTRPDAIIRHPRVVRRASSEIVRYRSGMSLWQLERYLDRIEYEYDLYGHMSAAHASYELGWSRAQLHEYVRWLSNERRFLRAERARLERLERASHKTPPGHGRGQGHGGHGRSVAAAAHRW